MTRMTQHWSCWKGVISTLLAVFITISCGTDLDPSQRSTLPELPEQVDVPDDQKPPEQDDSKEPGNDDLLVDENDDEDDNDDDNSNTPPPETPISRYFYWNWKCQDSEFSEQRNGTGSTSIPLLRPGQFKVKLTDTERAKLSIYSTVCPFGGHETDILLVVDVSRSMHQRDPRRNNSCGRLRSLRNVVKSFQGNDKARFALITFEDSIKYASNSFQTAEDFIQSNANSSRTVCVGHDDSHYDLAFTRSLRMFGESRETAYHEMYFISDGRPEAGHEGREQAEKLKAFENGNVLMVGLQLGDETTLKLEEIASSMVGGNRFYAMAGDADGLAQQSTTLATPAFANGFVYVKDPEYIKLHPFPIDNLVGGQTFQIVVDDVERGKFPTGLRVMFDYRDNRGRTQQYSGTLEWE